MAFLRCVHWFTRNWAATGDPTDPELAPVLLPVPVIGALVRIESVVRGLPRWKVRTVDPGAGTLTAERTTRFWGSVDEVMIRCEPVGAATRIHARSRSRVGVLDFGQNRRNLRELLRALREGART